MGIFSLLTGSVFDPWVQKATSETNTSEDWALIMNICDRVNSEPNGAKECFRCILRRLNSPFPLVVMQSLKLIDVLVSNCGKKFHLEVCSRDFENELRRLIGPKSNPKVSERARVLVKKWTEEFKNDPQLSLMPSFYLKLKSEGVCFINSEQLQTRGTKLKNRGTVNLSQEERDILKACELSLRDLQITSSEGFSKTFATSSPFGSKKVSNQTGVSLYPSLDLSADGTKSSWPVKPPSKDPVKVRALYDFEAAEENELTFKAGEIILVLDDSNANWWKGLNHRGEGLFPANFVSADLNAEPEPVYKAQKKVQFNDEVKLDMLENDSSYESNGTEPVVDIDESKIDRLLLLLKEADPQSPDLEELLLLEKQCVAMMPLIDHRFELVDKRNATLTTLNQQLNSALNLYQDLMTESFMMNQAAYANNTAHATTITHPAQMMPASESYGGYSHPSLTSQIVQPAPYAPNNMNTQAPAPQPNKLHNPMAFGLQPQYHQANMVYQHSLQSPQQMANVNSADVSVAHSIPMTPHNPATSAASKQPQPVVMVAQPSQSTQQQQPPSSSPYHHMWPAAAIPSQPAPYFMVSKQQMPLAPQGQPIYYPAAFYSQAAPVDNSGADCSLNSVTNQTNFRK